MSKGPENTFIASIHRCLPRSVYTLKNHNQYNGGIAGAGLLGRLAAWQLARQGHAVEVFDPAPDAGPRFRDGFASAAQADAQAQAAGFTAAGMLSPIAELDNAEPALAARG